MTTKNKLGDLNNHLFAQLERLAAQDLTAEQIETEVKRAAAIVEVADQISGLAEMQLRAAKLFADHRDAVLPFLPKIGQSE